MRLRTYRKPQYVYTCHACHIDVILKLLKFSCVRIRNREKSDEMIRPKKQELI